MLIHLRKIIGVQFFMNFISLLALTFFVFRCETATMVMSYKKIRCKYMFPSFLNSFFGTSQPLLRNLYRKVDC